jgi:hypothetical protein
MKRILCWFGFHDWKTIERKSIAWTTTNDDELTEVVLKCSGCEKEGRLLNFILKQTSH